MAFTLNRRLSTLVDSSGQLKTGKIPNDYINGDHVADNVITTAMLHTGFTLPISSLSSIDTDNVTEGSTNLFYTTARVDSHLSGGTGVTYSSGAISIGQAVATTDSPTFADLTITGNLNITGDINSYNVTDLDVTDQTITLGAGQIEANSGGSGIVIDGSNASILWDETNDQFDFNKGINVDSNTLVVDGTNNRVGILQASPAVSLDIGSATDAFFVPKGTTAQRPTGVDGYFRYNTDDAQFEGYADGAWGAIAGSGGASAMETDNFTGDGSTTAFTLSSTVSSEDNLIVFIEGIYQNKGDYVASGTTITFDTAPVNSRRIVVQHIKSSISGNSTLYTSLTGDGSTTAFTLSGAPGNENNTQVFMDGVYQQKDSYTVSGTTLTFDAAPANNVEIEVMSFTQTTINTPAANSVGVAELNLSDGTAGQFITTDGNGTISFASGYTNSDVETYLNTSEVYTDATNNRLGIGAASPDSKLHIDGNFDGPLVTIHNTGGASSAYAGLEVETSTTGTYVQRWLNAGTELMRVEANGNIGIGTPNPDNNKLVISDSSDVGIQITKSGVVSGSVKAVTTGLAFGVDTSSGNTERMTIDSSGNVGIGTSSITNNTLGKTTYFGNSTSSITGDSSNARFWLGNNWYYNSGDKFIGTGYANLYTQQSGTHEFLTSTASGTAGAAATFKNVMGIDSSGRVTTPEQPAFRAQQSAASGLGTGSTTIGFDDTVTGTFDIGGNFNNSTNRFTAPVAGIYHFNASIRCDSMNAYFRISIVKNGAANYYTNNHAIYGVPSGNYENLQVGGILNLAANDYVTVVIYAVSDTDWNSQGEGYFSGYLV